MTGNMDNYFMPSEVARLILGYLIDKGLSRTMKTFIQECPDLTEFYQVMKSGRVPPTTILGQSLLDILNEFAELKLKSVRSGQSRVSAAVSTECSTAENDAIICARQQAQDTIKRQRLLWKGRKATQASAKVARKQTTTVARGLIDTPVSSCRHISTEGVSVSTPSHVVTLERTPASSEVTSPGSVPNSARSHVTIPEHASVSIPSHVMSPVIMTHISTPHRVTYPEHDVQPVGADAAIAEVENMPDMLKEGQATNVLALPPSTQTNLDTQVQVELVAKHSDGPSQAKTAAEDNVDLLDWLLEDTNFHEKLAENINKVLHECDPSQSRQSVGTFSETNNKDLASMISKGLNINQIIERTESDPTFQNFLQLFQQGTAVPLSQFDVPVINISSEVTAGQSDHTSLPTTCEVTAGQSDHTSLPAACEAAAGQPGHTSLPTACEAAAGQPGHTSLPTTCEVTAGQSDHTSLPAACEATAGQPGHTTMPSTCEVAANQSGHISLPVAIKTNSSEAVPGSCKTVPVEPLNCQGNVSAVASACSVNSEPTNLLHIDTQQSPLPNPYDPEKLDKTLTCDIGTTRVTETAQGCLSPTSKQSQTDDCHNHDRTNSLCQNNLSSFARFPKNCKVTEEYGSQNLADPNLSSSSQLVTSGISQKCVASDLNAVQDQVVNSESTGSKKSVISENCCPQVQGSSLSAESVSARNIFVPVNENSLTVFSLIEKSIAEMNGEQFVHRSMRNTPSSQTAGSVHTDISTGNRNGEQFVHRSMRNTPSSQTAGSVHTDISTDNRNGEHENLSAEATCNNTTREAVCCEDIVTNPVDSHARTDSSIKTGSNNVKKPLMSICSDQNASTSLAETVVKENIGTNYIARKNGHVAEIAVNTKAFDAQVSLSVGKDISVDQEEGQALCLKENGGYAVVETHQSCLGLYGVKNTCTEIEASHSVPELSEQNKTNNTQSPGKKNSDNLHNSTLYADCPVVIETQIIEETETNARNACVSTRELRVDKQEFFCMSPPLRKPDRLQPTRAQPHTKKTCINKQTEVKRSQSLCNCSAGSTFQDEQITEANGNSAHEFCEQSPVITSPPYLPLNMTDNNTHDQLCASIYPQATCSSLPATLANVRVPGSPHFSPLSCNSSVKQTLQMTPQGKQLHINSTEDNQMPPKTVKRRVIAFHSEHSPFIPDHCKKNPSRRIVPKEVDYSTPSPLQDCPSSPMNYVVDVSLSQPDSPHNSRESLMRPSSSGKTLPPVHGHVRIIPQRSLEASFHNETSSSCSGAHLQVIEGQQKVTTPDVSLSHLEKLGIKLPPSPSKRKPRRINPVQLSTVANKDWSGVTRSSSVVLHGGFSPVVDDARIVSSTSDNTTSSEEEAFRLLKSFLSSSYSKPQPRQEITSTDQKIGLSKCVSTSKLHNKHKGRGRKNPPVKRNILPTTSEAKASDMSKKDVLVAGDCDSSRRAQCLAEFVLSHDDSVSKVLNTQNSECMIGQSAANLCCGGNLPVKNSLYKVQCLHRPAQPSVSPCSHDNDISFAPVGIIECYPIDSDKQVQRIDSCKMATASSCSSLHVTVCENIQNVPCLNQTKDDTFKGSSKKSCAPETLCSYQNDITGAAVAHKITPEADKVRFTNSRLASVDDDQIASSNCIPQSKSPAVADGHYLAAGMQEAISAERLTNGETNAVGHVRNVTACSDLHTVASPTITVVANRAENKTCKHSTSTMKSLPSTSSASEEKHKTASSEPLTLKKTDSAVFRGCHFTQPQLRSCSQKYHDSGGSSPSANSLNRLSNVSDGVADAVYSLLSLVSRVDDKRATSIVSLADQNLLSKDDTNQVGATENLPMKNTKLSCHCPAPAASVAMGDSLLQMPVISPDVSLPSLVCSSLQLAHDIEHPFEVTKHCSSPSKHGISNWAGQGAKRTSENVCNGHINTDGLRPASPSSISLLSKAMADSGIPFDGSNLASLDTWTNTGGDISQRLPVSCVQTPDVSTAANAHVNTESKPGRKPRPKAQKPNHRNLAQIVPSLGGHKFDVMEQNTVEKPVPSGSFVKILPRVSDASSAVPKPQMMDTQEKSSLLCQIQMIPSANGPIIIIPPGLEGIIHNLLSENKEPSPQVLHAENNVLVDNVPRQPSSAESAVLLPTSCNGSISDLNPSMPSKTVSPTENLQGHFQSEAVVLDMAEETRSDRSKLEHSSADLHTTIGGHGRHKSDSLSSCAGEEIASASSFKCVRKIAVRRRIDFTHLKSSRKRQRTKGKNKVKAGAVAASISPVKQGHHTGVAIAKDIKGTHLASFSQVPGIKSSVKNVACKDKRNCQDYVVQSKNTTVTCEVKRQSKDCLVQNDVAHGICETNRQNSDLVQGDRHDQTKVPHETKKGGKICTAQTEKTKAAYEVKRHYTDCGDKTPVVCEDKTPVVCEDKTPVVCEDKKNSNSYSGRNNKTGVVCKVKKSGTSYAGTSYAGTSNTTKLAGENHSGGKKAEQVNEQEDLSLSDSEEQDEKCSGDNQLLSGSQCETVVSNKDIGSCGSTMGYHISTVENSAVSSLLILTQLLHERSHGQKSRNHEDREEVSVCGDTSEREVGTSKAEHDHSVIHAKSSDLVKPSKNNSKVKAGKIHKKQAEIVKTIKDSRNNKSILQSPDIQTTVSFSCTDSSQVKSTHSVRRKRKQKEMNLGVDQSDSVCKMIKLQVPNYQHEIKEHHVRSNQKSVRMVVDYVSGDNIVAGNLPEGSTDVFLTSKVEPEKQSNILAAVSQLKSKNKCVLEKPSSKNNRNICNDSSTANKCLTEGAAVQHIDKKLKTDGKNSAKLDECQYVGSVSFRSLFTIFNTVCPQGNPSSQPSLAPVDGSVQQSSGKPQHKCTENPSVAGTSQGRTTLRNRKMKAAASSERAKHQEHTNTSNHTVTATYRGHAASQNRTCKNVISTGDIDQGERPPGFQRNQEMFNGGNDINTAATVDVDRVASNMYDNETQNAVSALELCMREVTSEHTHYCHKQPDPLCDVSSQVNIDDSSVNALENSICQMSNTSSPNTKLQPSNLHDVSPVKFHLPPKKRLSSELIVNGTADTLVQHDYNSPILLDNDSTFNVHKLTVCQARPSSVGPSPVLQDSSKPNTVSSGVESAAACHGPLTGDGILHSSQPALLHHSSHADPLSTEIKGKTTDLSSVPVSHEELHVTSLSTRSVVLPSHSSSIDITLVKTDSLHETGHQQSPLPSCSLNEQHKQGSTSLSLVSADRNSPCKHRYDMANSEKTGELPSANKCEPHAVPESNVTLQTTGTPSKDPAELDEIHPVSRHNVDKLLRKLHQRKKTKHL